MLESRWVRTAKQLAQTQGRTQALIMFPARLATSKAERIAQYLADIYRDSLTQAFQERIITHMVAGKMRNEKLATKYVRCPRRPRLWKEK